MRQSHKQMEFLTFTPLQEQEKQEATNANKENTNFLKKILKFWIKMDDNTQPKLYAQNYYK